jgi:hypothetical protein
MGSGIDLPRGKSRPRCPEMSRLQADHWLSREIFSMGDTGRMFDGGLYAVSTTSMTQRNFRIPSLQRANTKS